MADPWHVTTAECAELFKTTEKSVSAWIRDGMPVVKRGRRGAGQHALIDLREAVSWYVDIDPLDSEKTRLAREQADKLALENAHRRGELVELAVWRSELEQLFGQIRAALLAIPTKEAPQLDGNVNQRKERLERIVREILAGLSTYSADVAAREQPARDSRGGDRALAAAETDGVRVGRSAASTVAGNKRRAR